MCDGFGAFRSWGSAFGVSILKKMLSLLRTVERFGLLMLF